ncbi:MAG: response regulator [Kiritimatiellia bacterium]|nr:response regulator [Kiritimatiellia bacterium]
MILVVEDDATQRALLTELLVRRGYEVRTASDGAGAYRHLRDSKCRGLVLDFHMPGINGPELLLLMAAEGIELPVLITTGDHDFDEAEMKQFPNVRKLLYKPLIPEDVIEAVDRFGEKPQP